MNLSKKSNNRQHSIEVVTHISQIPLFCIRLDRGNSAIKVFFR